MVELGTVATAVLVLVAAGSLALAQSGAETQGSVPAPGFVPVVPVAEKEAMLDLAGGAAMKLRLIPAGKFTIGTPPDQVKSRERRNEKYQKEITLFRSFYMGLTEITQAQWKAVMGTEPWAGMPHAGPSAECAANYISWAEATVFCEKLSDKTGWTVQLPSEAQWTWACRAGATMPQPYGEDPKTEQWADYTWHRDNVWDTGRRHPQRAGLKKPNAWGLHDMHGNLWEWCRGKYRHHYKYLDEEEPTDFGNGMGHAVRGGSFKSPAEDCGSERRFWYFDLNREYYGYVGFRIVATPPVGELPEGGASLIHCG